jgi:alcohol dehydrogenase
MVGGTNGAHLTSFSLVDVASHGRELGTAVAEGMLAFNKAIGSPTSLQNMPVALTADDIDEYMGPILQAAKTGSLSLIKNVL